MFKASAVFTCVPKYATTSAGFMLAIMTLRYCPVNPSFAYGPNMDLRDNMGERIRSMRKAKGMTQMQLCKLAGITQGTLSPLERGDTKKVQASTLLQIAKALGVNVEYLRTGAETPVQPQMVTVEESELLALYRELPKDQQEKLLSHARDIHSLIEQLRGTASNPYKKAVSAN